MNSEQRTWEGGQSDDRDLLNQLPDNLRSLIASPAGFILHHGAVHFRGCVSRPDWHSLREAWHGEHALHRLYPGVLETDIPFAQDQLGDQYLLRGIAVFRLNAETGDVGRFADDLETFLAGIASDINEYLNVGLDRVLPPGHLFHAYPPFCMVESERGVSLRAVPADELILFHADLARQIRDVPDGGKVTFTVTE